MLASSLLSNCYAFKCASTYRELDTNQPKKSVLSSGYLALNLMTAVCKVSKALGEACSVLQWFFSPSFKAAHAISIRQPSH